jgi:hypothetical protein
MDTDARRPVGRRAAAIDECADADDRVAVHRRRTRWRRHVELADDRVSRVIHCRCELCRHARGGGRCPGGLLRGGNDIRSWRVALLARDDHGLDRRRPPDPGIRWRFGGGRSLCGGTSHFPGSGLVTDDCIDVDQLEHVRLAGAAGRRNVRPLRQLARCVRRDRDRRRHIGRERLCHPAAEDVGTPDARRRHTRRTRRVDLPCNCRNVFSVDRPITACQSRSVRLRDWRAGGDAAA